MDFLTLWFLPHFSRMPHREYRNFLQTAEKRVFFRTCKEQGHYTIFSFIVTSANLKKIKFRAKFFLKLIA